MSARLIYDDGATPAPSPAKVVPATPKSGPSLRVILPWVAVAALFVIVVGVAVVAVVGLPGAPDVPPDSAFVAVGRDYVPTLGSEYAGAWEDGAKILDAGQPIATALDTVAKSWEANRVKGFHEQLTPALSRVVPESKPEKDVTPAERAALAKAWRDLATGLRGR